MRFGFSVLVLGGLFTSLAGACAPATFDGLSGGDEKKPIGPLHESDTTTPDASLKDKDPRPVSPFSAAWVNTDKPRFTWALQDGTTGATVELSHTRDFARIEHRFTATGSEYTVTDTDGPLDQGVWFWRLQARNTNPGISYSAVWSVLVRGKSKNATKPNTAAHGPFNDFNGDGLPDLLTAITTKEPTEDGKTFLTLPTVLPLFSVGTIGHYDPFNPMLFYPADAGGDTPALASGDIDGDGFGDLVAGDFFPAHPPYYPVAGGAMYIGWGGPKGYDGGPKDGNIDGVVEVQDFDKVPALAVADFNGDGYGDISVILPDMAMTALGTKEGWLSLLPFEASGGVTPATSLIAGGDFDGDGKSDLAYTPYDSVSPLRLAQGNTDRYTPSPNITNGADVAPPTRATALATGDFDGDGFDEVAFATTVGGKAAVCVTSLGNTTLSAHACWVTDAAVTGFGTTLGAGDADGDGVDEIFVGSTAAGGGGTITILTHAGVGYADDTSTFTPKVVAGDYTANFSVFYPGRPGKAQWAVYGKDGHTLHIVEGFGDASAAQQYDFTKMKDVKDLYAEFLHFGTSIH